MINVKNLSISYGKQMIIDDVSFSLPRTGLICICGDSGSGKSSLLNAISCLIPFSGSIRIDGLDIRNLSENEAASFRLKHIGFVFQDFKLFMNQTVEDNVEFPLRVLSNDSKRKINRRANDMLRFCEVNGYAKRACNSLSGGEKQRVAIARALINNPKILICDEPTGSLDENTGKEIMKLIKSYSEKGLVLMVTHDKDLANTYADQIMNIENKKIRVVHKKENINKGDSVALLTKKRNICEAKIPFSFSLNHAKENMKQKKVRTVISTGFMSLGLLGIGLSIAFSNSISNDIKRSYSSLAESSVISIEKKSDPKVDYDVLSFEDAKELVEKYDDRIVADFGVGYRANFEEFFKDSNSFYLFSKTGGLFLNEFSVRHFNDFIWLDEVTEDIFPSTPDSLLDDEIILGLTINQIRSSCASFGIEINVNALSEFFKANTIKLTIELENSSWSYWDEQIFTVVGFALTNEPFIAHSNHLFNQVMFEENMRFPTNEQYDLNEYPWVLEKITYIKTANKYDFISLLREQNELNKYCFEVCDQSYFINKLLGLSPDEIQYLIPYYSPNERITKKEIDYIQLADNNICKPILYNYGGYVNYPSNLISGFAHRCYFSFSEDDLMETIENNASVQLNKNETEILKETVMYSDFSKIFDTHIAFFSNIETLYQGREPTNLHEIVVSKKLFDDLNLNSSNYLYIAVATKEIDKEKGNDIREYETAKLKVVGIEDSDEYGIYHNYYWTEDFFNLVIGLNVKETAIHSISFSLRDESKIDDSIYKLKRAFPQYEIINPLSSINDSIDSLCSSISLFIFIISAFSLNISLILLCSCTYLHLQDIRKEIALARCIGINGKDSLSFLNSFMFFSLSTSLLISFFELTFVSLSISYFSSDILSLPFEFSISFFAYLAMSIGALLIGLVSIGITSKHIKNIKPIDCLKI